MQKKLLASLLACALGISLAACGSSSTSSSTEDTEVAAAADETEAADTASEEETTEAEEPAEETADTAENVEVVVFAAASMTETLTEISEMYKEVAPNVTLTFNFDSSGTLKTQIQEGAACDLFISAGQTQMNQLDINADPEVNTEGLDFVDEDSRVDILENRVTLCVTPDNEAGLESFDDMAAALQDGSILMAMGNSDVPVGQYTQRILEYYGLNEEELAASGVISYGSNVKEVATQIAEGSVDCGVIYCTDAYSEGLNIVDYATADMCGQVIYPAAVLKTAAHPEEAQAFLDYLQTDECMAVFEEVGFSGVE
ncbi:molybdate ABC transporter substrate-binding protein [Lachnoclostridium sp. An196]|uniref:molybdate ABC transporter substrate-binding protein n=1 Tax=Lachnoclostridium sp. An196 TaxID=1965583 RepID=UPI000B371AE6|nr:molybdate ABC transporter substrate-binding protein [Lachnoclostridium sp. An196]OUP15996.1 molybdate ABC transporter substrate-binding protein [Lachnoclostridium sp. An196]